MFSNELDFCKKVLQNGSAISYHEYSVGSGYTNKQRARACRLITVDKNYKFQYISGPCDNGEVLSDSYALMYRSNPSDTSKVRHYFFGDIYIPVDKKTSTIVWTDEIFKANLTTQVPDEHTLPQYLKDFQQAMAAQVDDLIVFIRQEAESVKSNLEKESLKKLDGIFFHFDLSIPLGVTQWYEIPGCLDLLDSYELSLVKDSSCEYIESINKYALTKTFLHTLTSGDDKGDNQFVNFDLSNRYKSLALDKDDLRIVLFYYSGILGATTIPMRYAGPRMKDFMFRLIPAGSFGAADAASFIRRIADLKKTLSKKELKAADVADAESQVTPVVDSMFEDPADIFKELVSTSPKDFVSFDLILVKNCGNVLLNVSEISNVSRSTLSRNLDHIEEVAAAVYAEKKYFKPSVARSFYSIHRQTGKGEKFQAKFVKTLMKIYTGTYYSDPELSRIFIDRAQAEIRQSGIEVYSGIAISYSFLKALQKEVSMDNLKSGELGKLCARVAWPLGIAIGSFEKSEIGYLSRRISCLDQVPAKLNEYREGSLRHDNTRKNGILLHADGAAFHQAVELLKEFQAEHHVFDRDAFALGFLDEYGLKMYHARNQNKQAA